MFTSHILVALCKFIRPSIPSFPMISRKGPKKQLPGVTRMRQARNRRRRKPRRLHRRWKESMTVDLFKVSKKSSPMCVNSFCRVKMMTSAIWEKTLATLKADFPAGEMLTEKFGGLGWSVLEHIYIHFIVNSLRSATPSPSSAYTYENVSSKFRNFGQMVH